MYGDIYLRKRLLIGTLLLTLAVPLSAFGDSEEDREVEDLAAEVARLREKVDALSEARERWRDWSFGMSGEFRARALVEANTRNNFTNKGGVTMHAYRGDSTTSNDYGWWDYRAQLVLDVEWRDLTRLHTFVQIGNAAWGNQAPLFGGSRERSFGNMELVFRELYVEVGMAPIPLRLRFGRFDAELGNRLIWGLESDGLDVYYRNRYVRVGFMGFRQYEGERYEFSMSYNDDEDTFIVYWDTVFNPVHSLSVFGYLTLYEIPKTAENAPDVESPLYNIPRWNPEEYGTQGNNLYTAGVNYMADWERVRLNIEFDYQWGTLFASSDYPEAAAIHFRGFAAVAKLDYRPNPYDVIAITAGYGSGDDPNTLDYEGFFAPDNDFGIEEDLPREYIDRGYFAVYEHLSPGAGVPGGLFEGRGTGGIENTIFGLLGFDMSSQPNHHYYIGVGAIWAAEPNPETGSYDIGVEIDASIDYQFGERVSFRTYGGHLFVTGDYFRREAYDAASIYWEWKVTW